MNSKMAVIAEGAWLISVLRFLVVCFICSELPAPQLLCTT